MLRFVASVACVWGLVLVPSAFSQGFGYGYPHGFQIRSPFFNLDVNPTGTTVYSPGASVVVPNTGIVPAPTRYGYVVPRPPFVPPFGLPDVARFEYYSARPYMPPRPVDASASATFNFLANAAMRLDVALRASPQGETWLNFLRPSEIRSFAMMSAEAGEIERSLLPQMQELASRYEGTLNSREFAWVARLSGFREVAVTLHQLVGQTEDASGLLDSQDVPNASRNLDLPPVPSPATVQPQPSPLHPESRLDNPAGQVPTPLSGGNASEPTPAEILPTPEPVSGPRTGSF